MSTNKLAEASAHIQKAEKWLVTFHTHIYAIDLCLYSTDVMKLCRFLTRPYINVSVYEHDVICFCLYFMCLCFEIE